MGIAYLLMLIVYIALAKGIYSIIVRPTTKVWIKRSLIAFFILLPTYDIIIGNALKFYYCQFTELEKINRTIERPEGILLVDLQNTYDKEYALNDPETYIDFLKLKYVQIKRKNDHIRTYISTGEYIDHNDNRRLRIVEVDNPSLKPRFSIIKREPIIFPSIIGIFLFGYETKIIDNQTNEVVAWAKGLNHQKYNFITIDTGYFLRGKSCGSSYDVSLFEAIIKKDKK